MLKILKDPIAIEEPLQIDIIQSDFHTTYSITLRTPGEDCSLSYGLLFTEGVIGHADDVLSIDNSEIKGEIAANLVTLQLSPKLELDLDTKFRRMPSYSGCGICGKTNLKALALKHYRPQKEITTHLAVNHISQIRRLLAKQDLFNDTGGSHVAGIIHELGQGSSGKPFLDFDNALFFEDIGRHNALDKLIGSQLFDNDLTKAGIILLSGRVGYELVQKIVMAGFSTMVALGAPTSLAIQAANQFGVTLIGFAKDDQFNLYTL